MAAWFNRTWVCCSMGGIRKRSSMSAFTGGDSSGWKIEMSIPADMNSKITFIPAKINIIETIQCLKFSFKFWCQLDGAVGQNIKGQTILGVYRITPRQKRSADIGWSHKRLQSFTNQQQGWIYLPLELSAHSRLEMCSQQRGTLDMEPFCTDRSINLFFLVIGLQIVLTKG